MILKVCKYHQFLNNKIMKINTKIYIYESLMGKYHYTIKRKMSSRNILSLSDRGIWHDRFPSSCLDFEKNLASGPLTAYCGFDPTGSSLHIGNLLVLKTLIHFQRSGHNVIVLIGGATARIGDPSGKSKERPMLEASEIESNSKSIKSDIERIFNNHEQYLWKNRKNTCLPVRIVDNYDWYKAVNLLMFLREVGKHMRMGALVKRSAVESRLSKNEPLSYTEFSYQIMQAYDWLHLYKNYNCTVQIGGSDQMGNIVSGHDLISRIEDVQVTGLTVPLITSEAGDKLGKTSGSPVWLNPEKTSAFEFYQFFVRVKDSEVERLLKLLTFIPLSEIEVTMNLQREAPEKKRAQKKLAEHLTLLVHGEEGLKKAKQATQLLYAGDSTILADMKPEDVIDVFEGVKVETLRLHSEMSVLEMAMKAKCFSSEERAVEAIEKGGFHVNQGKVTTPHHLLVSGIHILPNGFTLLRVGKKNYVIVQWESCGQI